jgi:hypothetical protein
MPERSLNDLNFTEQLRALLKLDPDADLLVVEGDRE